jgi:hypothetical protein
MEISMPLMLKLAPLSLSLAATMPAPAHAADIAVAQRAAAAEQTARTAASCKSAQPFYWEIGDGHGISAGGPVGANAPARDTQMHIASASKLVYSAYVAEKRGGALTGDDIRFLTFESGYTRFRFCRASQTEGACLNSFLNGLGQHSASTANRFDYNGGHMQKHAAMMGMADMSSDAMAAEIHKGMPQLGASWNFSYVQAQPAGGGASSVADYAHFLTAILNAQLQIAKLLGTHKVCTNPKTCPGEAIKTPIPQSETWHYSIGHWVEDDPKVGDGAYSSPGAFGFYPWISADKQYYGIVGREKHHPTLEEQERPAVESVDCGRDIRAAWMSGQSRP